MKALVALILLAPVFVVAQTLATWEPMKAGESNAKYSEGWKYGDCVVWALKDSSAIYIIVQQENYIDPKHIPDGNPLPRTLTEEITIAPGTNGKADVKMFWSSASAYALGYLTEGPDLFALHYREAARALPQNIKEKFLHQYGIEP